MAFNLLFRQANQQFGYHPSAFKQRNTLSYENEDEDEHDEDEDDDADVAPEGETGGAKSRSVHKKFIVDEPDLHRLMNVVHRVNPRKLTGQKEIVARGDRDSNSGNNDTKKCSNSEEIDINDRSMKPFYIPEVDWQKELDVILKSNSSEDDADADDLLETDNNYNNKNNSNNNSSSNNNNNKAGNQSSNIFEMPALNSSNTRSLNLLKPFLLVDNIDNRCYYNDSSAAGGSKFDPLETLINPTPDPEVVDLYDFKPVVNDVEETGEPVAGAAQVPDKLTKMEAKHERMKSVANYVKFDTSLAVGKKAKDDSRSNRNLSYINVLNHHNIAKRHKNTKKYLDLSETELKNFHRPRLSKTIKSKPWHVKEAVGSTRSSDPSTRGVGKIYAESDKLDLSLINGDFLLLEYVEEIPPIILNFGMVSSIINFYRTSDDRDNEEKKQRSKLNAALKLGLNENTLTDRIPRHVRLLINQRDVKQSGVINSTTFGNIVNGELKVLSTSDDRIPFLADIKEGQLQQCLLNNMFNAPIFAHPPKSCDFLLICTSGFINKINTKNINWIIKEIPKIFVVGQTEPQMEVPSSSEKMSALQTKILTLALSRYFFDGYDMMDHIAGVDFNQIHRTVLKYSASKACYNGKSFKKVLKTIADENSDLPNKFCPKDHGIDTHGERRKLDEVRYEEQRWSPEELEQEISPEEICLQAACNAAEVRLKHYTKGLITDLDLDRLHQWLLRMDKVKEYQEETKTRLVNFAETAGMKKSNKYLACNALISVLENDIKRLKHKIQIAQCIFDRLARIPWNATAAYVRSRGHRDDKGKMIIDDMYEPSGRGEAYSFMRLNLTSLKSDAATKGRRVRPMSMTTAPKPKVGSSQSDVRKLTVAATVEILVSMGIPRPEVLRLKRWDRTKVIQVLATKARKGGYAEFIHKYARESIITEVLTGGLKGAGSFRATAQRIWDKQALALSAGSNDQTAGLDMPMEIDGGESSSDDDINDLVTTITQKNAGPSLIGTADVVKPAATDGQLDSSETLRVAKGNNNALRVRVVSDETKSLMESSSSIDLLEVVSAPPPDWVRPSKVVKEVKKIINEDGAVTITIKYLLSPDDVNRVSKENAVVAQQKKQVLARINSSQVVDPNHSDEEPDKISRQASKLSFRLDLMTQSARTFSASQQQEDNDVQEIYKPAYKSTARGVGMMKNYRLPHVSLAARFEKEVMYIWRDKRAYVFRYPVPTTIEKYYDFIKNPICLNDIREKISSYQYNTADEVLADLDLMVNNCVIFNGANSVLAKNVIALVKIFRDNLFHEKTHLGKDKDVIKILEDACKKKAYMRTRARGTTEVKVDEGGGEIQGSSDV